MWTNTNACDDPALVVDGKGRKLLRECRAKRTHKEFQIFPFLLINIKNNIKKSISLSSSAPATAQHRMVSLHTGVSIHFQFPKSEMVWQRRGASGGGWLTGQGWVDVVDVLKCCKRMKKFPRYNKNTKKFLSYHPLSPQPSFAILSIIICLFFFRHHLRFPPHFGVFIFGNIENA